MSVIRMASGELSTPCRDVSIASQCMVWPIYPHHPLVVAFIENSKSWEGIDATLVVSGLMRTQKVKQIWPEKDRGSRDVLPRLQPHGHARWAKAWLDSQGSSMSRKRLPTTWLPIRTKLCYPSWWWETKQGRTQHGGTSVHYVLFSSSHNQSRFFGSGLERKATASCQCGSVHVLLYRAWRSRLDDALGRSR